MCVEVNNALNPMYSSHGGLVGNVSRDTYVDVKFASQRWWGQAVW